MILRFIHMFCMPCTILSAVLLLASCAQPASYGRNDTSLKPTALMQVNADEHVIAANDILTITIFREADLSGDYTVAGNGVIDMPLVGPVTVAGQTVSDLPAVIASAYRGQYLKDPKVTVALKMARPFYILGEVTLPGSYPWSPNLSVVNAVALAHGFTSQANQKNFEIIRDGQAMRVPAGIHLSTPIMPGDVVRVIK